MKHLPLRPSTVITCHAQADWDAFASMIGLLGLYPDAVMLFPGTIETPLSQFFNDTAVHLYDFVNLKDIDPTAVQRVVIADTRQRSRIRHIWPLLEQPNIEVHAWDHHPGSDPNLTFDVEKVADVGAVCTLICQEYIRRDLPMNCTTATLLGVGIYADTGNLTYASTSEADFLASAHLYTCGMDLSAVADLVQHTMTARHVRLLNAMLDSAASYEVGVSTFVMAHANMDVFVNDFAVLAQKFLEMEDCDALFALGNMDDKILVVGRSRVEAINVGLVCKALGGGGHPQAASASVKNMSLTEVKDAIFRHVYAQGHPGKCAKDIMSSPPVGIDDDQPLVDAEHIMNRYGLKAAPVFRSATRQCVGYMECQIASRAVAHGLGHMPVSEYMQRHMLTVPPDSPLQRLMDIIVGARQRLVPVVENGETLGVVTRTDLINMFVEDPERLPLVRPEAPKERELGKLLRTRLPKTVLALLHAAGNLGDELGVNVFAVGGFVRDVLLSRPATEFDDVDIVVEGDALAFARLLSTRLHGRVREHRTFLTALIIYTDENGLEQRLDVATARLEYYKYPAALPTVELSSIKMDLFRRDFTINAMALRINATAFGRLVDFFGGQSDVQRRIIRVIHALSFVEDPTRMLRAVRFEQRYGFHLSIQCEKLIKNALSLELVDKLSGRRIAHELCLIFREQSPQACLTRLDELGLLRAIYPALTLTNARTELLARLREVRDWHKLLYLDEHPDTVTMYLLALSSGLTPVDATAVFERLELPKSISDHVVNLRMQLRQVLNHLVSGQRRSDKVSDVCTLLDPIPIEGLIYLMARTNSENVSKALSEYIRTWRFVRLDISGKDLREAGLTPGPMYSDILRSVLAARQDEKVHTRNEQLALACKLISEQLA